MKFDFLFCSERSGSNLVTKMMDAHPEICGPFPTQLMGFFIPNLYRYGDLSSNKNWQILVEDIVLYLNSMHSVWVSEFNTDKILNNVKERSFQAIHTYLYEQEAEVQGKSRLFIKDNHAYKSVGYIEAVFDKPKYVWVVRDPRDALVALLENGILPGGARYVCNFWNNDQQGFLNAYTYLKSEGRIILITFEDLLADTETQLRMITEFLGLEFDVSMLNFHQKDLVKNNSSKVSAWNDLQKPIIKNNFNVYKEKLTEIQIKYVEARSRELMDYFGYKREFSTYDDITKLEAELEKATEQKVEASDEEKSMYANWNKARKVVSGRKLY